MKKRDRHSPSRGRQSVTFFNKNSETCHPKLHPHKYGGENLALAANFLLRLAPAARSPIAGTSL
ncbi:hypothetical protein [Phormidium sp. CCY1219]|uniref:hypothetical protein n=1 Tax=Phormidium sp. CCY1219 TaxID=2886104 RepID=UPI002D1F3DC5|nr:hypothetical protein [Phormidium sp. CCY1219]MEB3827533.1 hypothetical protein [Phormidium sp. CCY1219]